MGEEPRALSPTFPDIPLDEDFDDLLELAMAGEPESPRGGYAPQNAVHMEIQENGKLPTLNLTIDRSNSVPRRIMSQQPYSPTTRREIEEMMRLSEKDFSLAEVFLKSNNRTNQNVNYGSSAGAMLGSVGDRMGENGYEATTPQITVREEGSSSNGDANIPNPLSSAQTDAPQSNVVNPPGRKFYDRYQRPYQLPIPRSTPSPAPAAPKALTMADAIATAAAIVSQVPSDTKPGSEPMPHRATPSPTQLLPMNTQTQPTGSATSANRSTGGGPPTTMTATAAITPQSYHQYPPPRSAVARPSMPYSRLNAAAAAASTPKIRSATKQRSQFGFGGNHQVPCVPLPPKRASVNNNKKKKSASKPGTVSTSPVLHSSSLPPILGNAGPAYERKKQRAKDARVKLNDSIERLSIAMSMAGTQSQQRALQSASALMSAHCKRSMETCAETAESAKKWDRPGFVGTAATLIQTLNAQCESLMRELIKYQQEATVANGATNGVHTPNNKRASSGVNGSKALFEDEGTSNSKRLKLVDTSQNANELRRLVFCNENDTKMINKVASFLDPQSLLRCQRLTRRMSSIFGDDSLWLDRCIQRFGLFHVRQWKEKLRDEENDDDDGQVQPPSSIMLYRHMDAENVKPIHSTTTTNHHVDLAEARMTHQVSGWVTMVERSNGETCRSVKHPEEGRYTSLPVVELRFLIQNTGSSSSPIVIRRDQIMTVDASTRRRGEEWKEIAWDGRFQKQWLDLQDQPIQRKKENSGEVGDDDLVQLRLYESVVLLVHIHCKGCSTSSKFQQRANFTKVLVQVNGTTVPLVIPFFRES